MFVALLHRDEQFAQAFSQVPVVSDEPMHLLLYEMMKGSDYSDRLMTQAREATFVQKLTYKFPTELLENPASIASVFSRQIDL